MLLKQRPRISKLFGPVWPVRRQIFFLVVPIILTLLPAIVQTKQALCAYVVILMGIMWMTEIIPLAATALVPLVLYPLFGIVSAKDISREYLADTNFIFMGSLIMAIAVEITNLHERVALRILLLTGTSPRWLMLGFQLSTCIISMWITNTATAAMMLPILMRVICELERCHRLNKSRLCATNSAVSDLSLITPSDTSSTAEFIPANFTEEELKSSDKAQLNIYKGLLLSVAYTASIGGTGTLVGTAPNLVLSEKINELYPGRSPLSFSSWMLFAVPGMLLMGLFCWLWLQLLFIGFKKQDKETEKAVHRLLSKRYDSLGSINYGEKTVLTCFFLQVLIWVTRNPGFVPGWGRLFVKEHNGRTVEYATDGTAAIAVALLLFILPKENPFRGSENVDEFSPILTWPEMQKHFSWGTIVLLGGSYAMAKGVKESGLSNLFGNELTNIVALPQWLFVSLSAILATALTEFSSNVATASIFVPILTSIACENAINPMRYLLPVIISCSFAFMFPAGTPPNAIVFSSGLLRVTDMFRAGVMLNVFGLILTVSMTYSQYADWIFNMNILPDECQFKNTTGLSSFSSSNVSII